MKAVVSRNGEFGIVRREYSSRQPWAAKARWTPAIGQEVLVLAFGGGIHLVVEFMPFPFS